MDNENHTQESLLDGNDAFVNKLLSEKSSVGHSSRRGYYCNDQCVVPFTWEEEPGIPKDLSKLDIAPLPPINPPPSMLRPLNGPKPASSIQPRSCFIMMKHWRNTKHNKKAQRVLQGKHYDDALEESREFGDCESYISDDDMFSSPRVSKYTTSPSSVRSNSAASSSEGLTLASKFRNCAKGILRRFF